MADEQPLQNPQLKGPKGPGPGMGGLSNQMGDALKLVTLPVKLAKVVINPLAAPKTFMEVAPGGAGASKLVGGAANLMALLGKLLTNPKDALKGVAVNLAQGKVPGAEGPGGAGALGGAAKGAQAAAKAGEAAGAGLEAGGSGLEGGGTALSGIGKAVQPIPIAGQILGIPMVIGGQTMRVSGTALKTAGKGVKVTSKALGQFGKAMESVGKAVKPVLKVAKKTMKVVKKTTRVVVAPVQGAQRIGGGLMAMSKLQDHAAKGDLAAVAKTAKGSVADIAGGAKHSASGGGFFRGLGSRLGSQAAPQGGSKPPLKERSIWGRVQASARAKSAAGATAPKGLLSVPKGLTPSLPGSSYQGGVTRMLRQFQAQMKQAGRVVSYPVRAVRGVSHGLQRTSQAAMGLGAIQDHAAKGDLSAAASQFKDSAAGVVGGVKDAARAPTREAKGLTGSARPGLGQAAKPEPPGGKGEGGPVSGEPAAPPARRPDFAEPTARQHDSILHFRSTKL